MQESLLTNKYYHIILKISTKTIAKNGGTNTVDVKVEYNSATTMQPVNTSSTATLTINYQQDLGQGSSQSGNNGGYLLIQQQELVLCIDTVIQAMGLEMLLGG